MFELVVVLVISFIVIAGFVYMICFMRSLSLRLMKKAGNSLMNALSSAGGWLTNQKAKRQIIRKALVKKDFLGES